MKLLEIVQSLEGLKNHDRLDVILQHLKKLGTPYEIQDYHTGANIFSVPHKQPFVGIGSHFDVVSGSPGANDNGSAIAVCLEVLRRYHASTLENIGVQAFFFDEEETGLLGSKAYVNEYGVDNMLGLINLEMVGMGDQLALWPLSKLDYGKTLQCFEQVASRRGVNTTRFDKIVTNTADHVSFRKGGLDDVFTVSAISDGDIQVVHHYYRAQEFDVDRATLKEIMSDAPLFKHYHKPTDLAIHLSEDALQMTADVIWDTLLNLDKRRYI